MNALAEEQKTLRRSYFYFAVVMTSLLPGLVVFFFLPLWFYNVFHILLSMAGLVLQSVVHYRCPRRVLPWLITVVYLFLVLVLGHEFVRDGFIRSGR
jgi:hypothetical protein